MDNDKTDKNTSHHHWGEPLAYLRFVSRLRPLAYTSEFGEGFRNVFPKLVVPAYLLSGTYVIADIGHNSYIHYKRNDMLATKYQILDSSLWHTSASMVLPSLTVHQVVKRTTQLCNKGMIPGKIKKFAPVVIGLGIIPFIIGPIDKGTDLMMDYLVRPFYPNEIKNSLILGHDSPI